MSVAIDYNLSKKEVIAFKKLKERFFSEFEDSAENDFRLYRFLKARNFNVNNAEKMLIQHLKVRQEMELDTILENYKVEEPFLSYYAENYLDYDKEGSLIILVDGGRLDHIGMTKSVKKEDYKKYILFTLERMQKVLFETTQKIGKPVGLTFIGNYENLEFAAVINKAVLEYSMEFIQLLEANSPEVLKVAYLVNVPRYFSIAYGVVKRFVPEETMKKIKIYGQDSPCLELLEAIDPQILPAFLGGERTDSDGNPNCEKTLKRGKPIPKHYYLKSLEHCFRHQADVKEYYIKANSVVTITHEVDTSGSFIDWEFNSKAHNIGFGIRFKSQVNEDPKELLPIERINAHLQSETGTFMCEEAGIYMLVLDNSFSWFRGKRIFLKSTVRKPDEKILTSS